MKKLEVFNKFKEFKYLVENWIDRKIKLLISNNGGEFFHKKFE